MNQFKHVSYITSNCLHRLYFPSHIYHLVYLETHRNHTQHIQNRKMHISCLNHTNDLLLCRHVHMPVHIGITNRYRIVFIAYYVNCKTYCLSC